MLSEQHRSKLDGIVSQMTANGESEDSIRMVVTDFKTKYDAPEAQPAQGFLKELFKPETKSKTTTSTPMLMEESEGIDFRGIYEGTKEVVKAVPDIAENLKDTFTTRQGLSDLWDVTKNAGVSGVKNVMSNYNELFWGGAQKGLEKLGFETLSGYAGKDKERSKADAKKSSDEIRKFFYGDGDVLGYSDPNDTRGFLERISAEDGEKEVAKIIGSQLPTFASLLGITVLAKGANLPAVPATLSASFAMNAGDAYQQGKDYYESTGVPMTPEQEAQLQKTAVLVGASTAPIDTYGISRIMKPSQFVNFKNQFIKEATNAVLDAGVDTVVEGGTEGLQEVIQNAWARTYNANQDLFAGVPEAIFGGGVFGGGSSAIINSSGLLRTGVLERIKSGKTPEEIKAEVKAGAEASGAGISDKEIDEAIKDAQDVYDNVTEDIISKLDSGKTVGEVALEVGQNAPVSIDSVVEFVQKVDDNRPETTTQASEKAITELNALADKVDDRVLSKTAKDLQDDFERVQGYINEQVKTLRDKVTDLRERVEKAEDRSTEKKRLKAQLENTRNELREAEGSLISKVEANAKAFRSFVVDYARELGADDARASEVADAIVGRITDEANITGTETIEDMINAEIGEIKPISTKNRRKTAISPKKQYKITVFGNKGEVTSADVEVVLEDEIAGNKVFVAKNKDGKYVVSDTKTGYSMSNISKGTPKRTLEAVREDLLKKAGDEEKLKAMIAKAQADKKEINKEPTQKEKVKKVVEKKGKASIKEIASETGILEPNIRRILGMGAKEGEFERVGDGVYTIKTKDGKEVAVVIPADAVETLPKLAKEGFKADMVFLDIPYDTPAVKGGNRGVKYNLVSVEDFSKILDATKTILRDENSPIIHMYSQATSGLKAMQKYNDLFTDKGFIPVGKGEYQKTTADGSPVKNMRGQVMKPEGIIVFNQSGVFDKTLDLQFKMVRPKGYQTEKPAEMLAKMIEMTTKEGDVILDPFAGSGVTGAEAVKKGRKAVLIEKDKEVAEKVTKPRVEKAVEETKTDKRTTPESAEQAYEIYWKEVIQKRIDEGKAVVVGADNLKDFFGKDYDTANHKMYSTATNMLYERAVKELPEKTVMFTAGGTGSGKSDFVVAHLEDGFKGVIYDSTGWNYEGLNKQVEFAKENGKNVEVYGIIPDIRRARAYTFKREADGEHPVTETAFIRTHAGAIQSMIRFIEDGGDVYVIDTRNITSKEQAENAEFAHNPLDTLKEVAYSEDNVKEQISNITKENFQEVISTRKEGTNELPEEDGTDSVGFQKKPLTPDTNPFHNTLEKAETMYFQQKYDTVTKNLKRLEDEKAKLAELEKEVEKANIPRNYADRTQAQRDLLFRYETYRNTVRANQTYYDYWSKKENHDRLKPENQSQANKDAFKKTYIATVKKLISQGFAVTPEMIAQFPEFTKAVNARARYEKGYKTSFANKSSAVDNSTKEGFGFKVKRQDGEAITPAQIKEITDASYEFEQAFGKVKDIIEKSDLTVAHTNGKHPFLSDAGGLHNRKENTISVGVDYKIGDEVTQQKAFAHELTHFIDNQSGTMDKSYNEELWKKALNMINGSSWEIERAIKLGNKLTPEERAKHRELKSRIGEYWRRRSEVFARLAEEYIAYKGLAKEASNGMDYYHNAFGYWKPEAMAELAPMLEAQMAEKIAQARARLGTTEEGFATRAPAEEEAPTIEFEGNDSEARRLAMEEVKFYLEASEAGRRLFVPQRDSMDYEVRAVASTFPQFVPENMRSRKVFDRLKPYWEKQERPSGKTPMLQELYDIFEKNVQERTAELSKELKTLPTEVDSVPFKTTSRNSSFDTALKKYKFNVEYGVDQAKAYLEDLKDRLKIDFDTEWVDAVVFDYAIDPIRKTKEPTQFAEGLMSDNTIALKKEMDAYSAEHESIHLTIVNLDRIEPFRRAGITREKLMRAMADKMGEVWNEKTDLKIEEQIAYDFEKYLHDKKYPKPKGIIAKFFEILKKLIDQFFNAYVETKGDIVRDYYDIVAEGYSIADEVTRLENQGVVKSFIEDGILDAYALDRGTKFKISEESDARAQKLKKLYNDTEAKVEKLEGETKEWKKSLSETLIEKAKTAKEVDETGKEVKTLSRFTNKKKKPVGKLTKRGEEEARTLEFENPSQAQEEVSAYLTRKQALLETRRQLQIIRRKLQETKGDSKEAKAVLRDVERRLKLRRRLLEQKDFYVNMGMKRGAKEQLNMVSRRGRVLKNTQDMIGISDERAKKIIAGRRIHLMNEKEFNDFMQEFVGKAQDIRATLDARDEVKGLIQAQQFNKVENLQKALGLPTIDKMNEAQAQEFASILYQYQFGDTFLTKRELETTVRTKFGEIRTERELLEKIEDNIGISRGELRAIDAKGSDRYKNWLQLANKNPYYRWLVGRKMLAKTKELKQTYEFRKRLDELTKKARASRKATSLKESIWDTVAPTDEEVFRALDTGDFSQLTPEERVLADFLTVMFRTKYEKLVENFKDFKGRQNYVTHMSRTFMETLKDTGSLKEAFDAFVQDKREHENVLEILAQQTGEVLAFDKFLPYMLKRSGQLVPSKNVSRVAMSYFTATTRKELLDEFIPEAMLTLHGYRLLTGQTEKGLDLRPMLEQFTKEYLNDAKGRKIDFVTRQGSFYDNVMAGFISWLSIKYIGGNPVLAVFNLFGDLLALSAGTTTKQKLMSLARIVQKNNANEAIRGIVGHNPFRELVNTQEGILQKFMPLWFSLMSGTSYLANQLTVRGMLTQEEFRTGIVSDERIQEIAQQINKFKLTDSYGRSLVGNTTAGKGSTQFKTWAIPFLITTMEHFSSLVKAWKNKSFTPENKQQAIELARIVVTGGLMYAVVQALAGAFEDEDDKDSYLWRQIRNNLNTIYGILAMPFEKDNLVPVVITEIGKIQDLLRQLWTMERYERPTATNFTGDFKALKTFKDIVIPKGATRVFDLGKEEGSPRDRLINEALETGKFDAEIIAMKTSQDWGTKDMEAREKVINNITQHYNAMKKYPDSEIVVIVLGDKNNEEKVADLVKYAKKVGADQAYAEVKEIMKDKELFANQKKKTGALISAQLFRDFQVEIKKLRKANQ